jgi:N-acetylmuramoyl-L-alanine amidase
MRILLVLFFLYGLPSQAALRVTIDPGHGGKEKGAVHGGIIEADIALQISKKLYQRLKKDPAFQTQILRTQNVDLDLEDRVKKSQSFHTDLFLSIHANANPNPKAQGTEFYIQNQLPVDEEELFLAHIEHTHRDQQSEDQKNHKPKGDLESILFDLEKSHRILKSYQVSSFLRKKWNPRKRMIRQGPFFVLSQNTVPSVLIEVGYLTHPTERKKLSQSSYQHQIARKIHFALKDYAKNMDKLPSGILKPQNAKTQ